MSIQTCIVNPLFAVIVFYYRFAFHDIEDMCIVVDLLQGGDLRYHLSKVNRFSEHNVTIYLLEIGSAIEYLRTLHIIHR